MAKPVNGNLFGKSAFEGDEKVVIRNLLEQKLGADLLAKRQGQGGSSFTYVEGWRTIELANSIFGFDGWSSSVVDITPDFIEEDKGRVRVGVTAIVKVTLKDGTFHEDVGYGLGENRDKGSAIEKAKKEAVTDARKRALRLFGNALGNSIYDKEHVKDVARTIKATSSASISYDSLRAGADASQGTPSPSPTPPMHGAGMKRPFEEPQTMQPPRRPGPRMPTMGPAKPSAGYQPTPQPSSNFTPYHPNSVNQQMPRPPYTGPGGVPQQPRVYNSVPAPANTGSSFINDDDLIFDAAALEAADSNMHYAAAASATALGSQQILPGTPSPNPSPPNS